MRIDWQMYEDGQLRPEERRAADEALRADPSAKRELDGLRSLRRKVRDAALREKVPVKRLERRLSRVFASHRPSPWRMRAVNASAAVFAVLLAFFGAEWFARPDTLVEERREFQSMSEATKWASDESRISVPMIQANSIGPLESVHAGRGWACFDYVYQNTVVHVKVSKGVPTKSGCNSVTTEGGELLVHSASGKVAFSRDGYAFTVDGAGPEKNLSVARILLRGMGSGANAGPTVPDL